MTEEELQAEIESQKDLVPHNIARFSDITVEWSYDDEKPMAWLRAVRDKKLAETDWTQNPDVPEATREKWREYRQSLRDAPQNNPNPTWDTANALGNVTWPNKPA